MKKIKLDYSNTIFYKIHCKNPDVKDIYIGHTTNFVKRKYVHKHSCINTNSANSKCKVYTIIREFGGWDNWKMEIIACHDCADHYAARVIEQKYFEEYNATMNSVEPIPKPNLNAKSFSCTACDFVCSKSHDYDRHIDTIKHKQRASIMYTTSKNIFYCEACKFSCTKDSRRMRHLSTVKHKKRVDVRTPSITNSSQCEPCDVICGNKCDDDVNIPTPIHITYSAKKGPKPVPNVVNDSGFATIMQCVHTMMATQAEAHALQISAILGSHVEAFRAQTDAHAAAAAEQTRLLIEAISTYGRIPSRTPTSST